ncbi:MAG: GTPase [Proteobacteria bacterium]|nr:MAG: GTPase [Pseudomonadota bacterium]
MIREPNKFEHRIGLYGDWRVAVVDAISEYRDWLGQNNLLDTQNAGRIEQLLETIQDDYLYIAFVAEFSRGKSELINATFFSDLGRRVLPSTAGRTTMCPTELRYDESAPSGIRLLPTETRESEHSVGYYKQHPGEWTSIPLDIEDPDRVAQALIRVTDVLRVRRERAQQLGFLIARGPDDDDGLQVGDDGLVEIPKWRHAVINYPHPLLAQGLVVLDTPGLNALGAEPELTLGMLSSAHAVVFVLAADTGVTKSDMSVWRNHVCGKADSSCENKLVVLNKVDVLWDDMRHRSEIEQQVKSQLDITARTLDVPSTNLFALSAQKALLGRTRSDDRLVHQSGIGAFENALANMLIPAKQDIVRTRIRDAIEDIIEVNLSILARREKDAQAHVKEIEALSARNVNVVREMLTRLKQEKQQLDLNMRRFQTSRTLFSKHTMQLYDHLNIVKLERLIARNKRDMSVSLTTLGMRQYMTAFLREVTGLLEDAAVEIKEIHELMETVYERFQAEHGLANIHPRQFSTTRFHREIQTLYDRHDFFIRGVSMVMTEQKVLVRRYYDTVMSKVREVFERANRDVEDWIRSVMSPLETEIREHQGQLRRRLESMKRISRTGDSLEERMEEMKYMRRSLNEQRERNAFLVNRIRRCLDKPADQPIPVRRSVARERAGLNAPNVVPLSKPPAR